jgi:hypothetical protein
VSPLGSPDRPLKNTQLELLIKPNEDEHERYVPNLKNFFLKWPELI